MMLSNKAGSCTAQAQAGDAKDSELKNQRKVRMSRLVLSHICLDL